MTEVAIVEIEDGSNTPDHFLVPAQGYTSEGVRVRLLVSKSTSVLDVVEWLGTADEYGPPKILRTKVR